MDWLAEVASIKSFGSITLHVAISVVDRFLKRQKVTRAKLQLLGVAAMVLCSRYVHDVFCFSKFYKYWRLTGMLNTVRKFYRSCRCLSVTRSEDFLKHCVSSQWRQASVSDSRAQSPQLDSAWACRLQDLHDILFNKPYDMIWYVTWL